MAHIDPDSPVPKYFQLREILLDLIDSDELSIGAAIPSERELCQRFGLSRMTVRQAVDHLVSEGRLHRVPGKGTFVARPKIELALQLTSFTDDMRARGMEPGSRDLDRRTVRASAHLAKELGIQPGEDVHFIERLRTADGEPLSHRARAHPGQARPRPGRARPVRQVAVRAAGEPLRAGHGRGRADHRRRHRRSERRRPAQTPPRRSRAAAAAQILLRRRLRRARACPPTAPTATSCAPFWKCPQDGAEGPTRRNAR